MIFICLLTGLNTNWFRSTWTTLVSTTATWSSWASRSFPPADSSKRPSRTRSRSSPETCPSSKPRRCCTRSSEFCDTDWAKKLRFRSSWSTKRTNCWPASSRRRTRSPNWKEIFSTIWLDWSMFFNHCQFNNDDLACLSTWWIILQFTVCQSSWSFRLGQLHCWQ